MSYFLFPLFFKPHLVCFSLCFIADTRARTARPARVASSTLSLYDLPDGAHMCAVTVATGFRYGVQAGG
jgi:hypothetical protein